MYHDLLVWQKAHEFVLATYQATRRFPADERFALTAQVRRSVLSIAANIVEGFARRNDNIFLNHLSVARGSLEETKYHLLVARDLEYLTHEEYENLLHLAHQVGKLLHAFKKGLSSRT